MSLPLMILFLSVMVQAPAPVQELDPAFQSVAQRFFATQQAEDIDAYLALWSATVPRPPADQLRFVFGSGDDVFSDITVERAIVSGETARIRVRALRTRTDARFKRPDGSPRAFTTRLQLALSLVREAGEWRIVREGAPADELAATLIDTADPGDRERLLQGEPELLNSRLVDAISRKADAFAQSQQYRPALAIYERSLEIARAIRDPRVEGRALQNIANSHYFLRNFDEARRTYEQGLALAREAGNAEGAASALVGIGTVLYSTYDYGAALTAYREALAIQERLADMSLIGTTLISTGNVLYLQGDFAAAIADYRRAEELKRKTLDSAGAASALEGLGRVYSSQGDYAGALNAFAGVLAERRTRNDGPRQALVLHSIGDIHFRLGNTDAARASYEESRQLFEKFKDLGAAGRVLQGAALTELVVGRFPAAERAYTESITACTVATDAECVARAQVGLGFALAAQKRFDDAVTWYLRSLASFSDLKMDEAGARARIGLAEALYGRGDYDKALEHAVTARRTAVALETDDVLWRALVSVSRSERKLGRAAMALGSARAAVLAVERMASAALERPGQAAPADAAAVYVALAVLQAEQGDAPAAFDNIEAMRAHSLRAALAGSERDIARGMTAEERAEEYRLATSLNTLLAQRASQRALPRPDTARLAALAAVIKEATTVRAAAQDRLFSRLPELRRWRGLGGPATSDDLEAVLDSAGKLVVQFAVDEHDVLIVLASRPAGQDAVMVKAFARPVERQDLGERIARALHGNALESVETWRAASKDLFSLLPIEVVEELSTADSILFVPDDTLWRVPFEAMPLKDRYLADRAAVTYATSITAIVRPTATGDAPATAVVSPSAPPRVVAVAAPELSTALVESLRATAPTWRLRTPEAAASEVAEIQLKGKAPADPTVFTRTGATRSALAGAAVSADVLHIAAPFRINSASPLFSRILLAEVPSEKPADAVASHDPAAMSPETQLDARHVFDLHSSARVVLLSDPSALSMRDASRGITPINWAWRATGATTMILRRWGGAESFTNQVVAKFYDALSGGAGAEQAIEGARAAVRETEAGRAPAAWAGWIVISGR